MLDIAAVDRAKWQSFSQYFGILVRFSATDYRWIDGMRLCSMCKVDIRIHHLEHRQEHHLREVLAGPQDREQKRWLRQVWKQARGTRHQSVKLSSQYA